MVLSVHDRDAGDARQHTQEISCFLAEGIELRALDVEYADDSVSEPERNDELGTGAPESGEVALLLADVGDYGGLSRLRNPSREAGAYGEIHFLHDAVRVAVARRYIEPLPVASDEQDRAVLETEHLVRERSEPLEHDIEVQSRYDSSHGLEQGLVFEAKPGVSCVVAVLAHWRSRRVWIHWSGFADSSSVSVAANLAGSARRGNTEEPRREAVIACAGRRRLRRAHRDVRGARHTRSSLGSCSGAAATVLSLCGNVREDGMRVPNDEFGRRTELLRVLA